MLAKSLHISLAGADRLITSYSVPGDILSRMVNGLAIAPGTDGNKVLLGSPGSLPFGLNRHMIGNVIAAIQRDMLKYGCK